MFYCQLDYPRDSIDDFECLGDFVNFIPRLAFHVLVSVSICQSPKKLEVAPLLHLSFISRLIS
jgi:hypothetical protein